MIEQPQTAELELGDLAIYDGSELFGVEAPEHHTGGDEDPLTQILIPQMKTYGEEDGRHKRK